MKNFPVLLYKKRLEYLLIERTVLEGRGGRTAVAAAYEARESPLRHPRACPKTEDDEKSLRLLS